MSNTSELSFDVYATGPDLHFTAKLDQTEIFNGVISDGAPQTVTYQFDDTDEGEHMLVLELSGKLPKHTEISATGEILEDRVINISDVAFDGIVLGHVFTQVSEYHHDHNGTTDITVDKFFGTMGCNGRVEMKFSTPIYLWLLQTM